MSSPRPPPFWAPRTGAAKLEKVRGASTTRAMARSLSCTLRGGVMNSIDGIGIVIVIVLPRVMARIPAAVVLARNGAIPPLRKPRRPPACDLFLALRK